VIVSIENYDDEHNFWPIWENPGYSVFKEKPQDLVLYTVRTSSTSGTSRLCN